MLSHMVLRASFVTSSWSWGGWLRYRHNQAMIGGKKGEKCDSCSQRCSQWFKTVKDNYCKILEDGLPDMCLEGHSVER